jgi:hypothetical protein
MASFKKTSDLKTAFRYLVPYVPRDGFVADVTPKFRTIPGTLYSYGTVRYNDTRNLYTTIVALSSKQDGRETNVNFDLKLLNSYRYTIISLCSSNDIMLLVRYQCLIGLYH